MAAENITSIDFEPACFDSFVHLAKLAFIRDENELALQSLVVWCYLGCHYANLAIGQMACERSLSLIQEHLPDNGPPEVAAIMGLQLRAMIDSGLVNQARKLALECEISLAGNHDAQKAIHLFDYNLNRSDLQRLLNDRIGALHFLERACESADPTMGSLKFVEASHRAALEIDPQKRAGMFQLLISEDGSSGTERHVLIAECMLARTEMLSELRTCTDCKSEVARCLARAKTMVDRQYMSALPLAYRAASLASYCAFVEDDFDPRAVRDLYRIAENSCVLKGDAESLPLVLNDMAIVEYKISSRLQDAMMFLSTAIDVLNRQGRLDLGNADLTSANQMIVSNYLRLVCSSKYAKAVDFVMDRVQWFRKPEAFSRGWVTRELDRMNDTGLPFLSDEAGIFRMKCDTSGLSLVG